MQGDLSRATFDRTKHYAGTLFQQGRVTLDADVNEQTEALLYLLRTVVNDIVGPSAAPPGDEGGFAVTPMGSEDPDLAVSAGRLYAEGVLVENEEDTTYWTQPDAYLDHGNPDDQLPSVPYLVYLRVWERLITPIQDWSIREIALGDLAPDTAARRKVIWQVVASAAQFDSVEDESPLDTAMNWINGNLRRAGNEVPSLQALVPPNTSDAACDVSPDSRYRGPENQLYRVEVHSGGAAQGRKGGAGALATFKFSRENGSVTLPISSIAGNTIALGDLGRDRKLGLEVGDFVEIADDRYDSRVSGRIPAVATAALRQIKSIDTAGQLVVLDEPPSWNASATGTDPSLHPYLRRWDHGTSTDDGSEVRKGLADDGAIPIVEGIPAGLEDGIQVSFATAPDGHDREYRRGDYWLIPARTIPGDVLWPTDETGSPAFRAPDGVEVRYAPLMLVLDDTTHDLRTGTRFTASISPLPDAGTTAKAPTKEAGAQPAKKADSASHRTPAPKEPT